ncbi:conserved exported hypothetical protein [Candidatus Nitrotoga sp. BS]|uniref:DUF3617 domain-containing protein n=1 Tax=Candidatus Nitrotoga sp. BS TaxID=2890408 RepID=UPI001EF20571|nr:DUF3617 family protein [Candidatus Nitrotoga sp. BS]CAH1211830.1 conserved exported hypothetical protein [Candidatus Nitrotoga sp. BS]
MNKHLTAILAILTSMLSAAAYAAPGEYWEVTSKMEIPGMPFAMPVSSSKVCVTKGGESDPRKTAGDKNCKMSDIKTVGNKVSWKARCDHDGDVMTGIGEQTSTPNSFAGKMQLTGISKGQDISMNMALSGKRIGGACDSEELLNKAKAQMCDTSGYDNMAIWISNAEHIFTNCADQRKKLCDNVRKDASKDAQTYTLLLQHDQRPKSASIAKECKLDMAATTKAICKTLGSSNYQQLSAYCPAEAKVYREEKRRKACEGRSFTGKASAESIRLCMSGVKDVVEDNKSSEADDNKSMSNEADAPHEVSKSSADNSVNDKSSANNPANGMLEGIKKLKGMFGF